MNHRRIQSPNAPILIVHHFLRYMVHTRRDDAVMVGSDSLKRFKMRPQHKEGRCVCVVFTLNIIIMLWKTRYVSSFAAVAAVTVGGNGQVVLWDSERVHHRMPTCCSCSC